MRVKKNSVKSLAKWVVFFIAIAMSAVFLSSCNASQSSSSNNNERTENTKDPTDNQNENTDDSSTPTDQGDIEIYAGPGSDYYYEGKIHYKDVRGIVLEDHEWLEVKYNNNQHGYIQRDMLENEDLSDVPLLVDTIPVTVGGRKYLETADFQYRLSGDIDLFEDTDALNKLTMVEKGNVITIVAPMPLKENKYQMKGGSEQEISYWLVEAITERGKERAYVGARDLFDLDNPLRDFSSVKENNLKLKLGNDTYYSASDNDYFKDDWETIKEFPLTHTEWNFWEGFLSVITSSDISLEDIDTAVVNGTKTEMPTLSKGKRTYTNTYTSLGEAGPISPDTASALLWLVENALTFLNESKQTQSFNVSLQQCKGENRLVIHTGVPIESMQEGRYYGKDFSLLELLLDKGYTLLTAADAADKYIRDLDSSFNGDKKYSMSIHFARQGKEDSPYGMRIIIDKEGNAYGSIILHQGTYFRITYDNKVVKDITKDIEATLFQFDNNTTNILLELLEKSGFEIIKRESVAAKEEKDEAANYDSLNYTDYATPYYNNLVSKYGRADSEIETKGYSIGSTESFVDASKVEKLGIIYHQILDIDANGTLDLFYLQLLNNNGQLEIDYNLCYFEPGGSVKKLSSGSPYLGVVEKQRLYFYFANNYLVFIDEQDQSYDTDTSGDVDEWLLYMVIENNTWVHHNTITIEDRSKDSYDEREVAYISKDFRRPEYQNAEAVCYNAKAKGFDYNVNEPLFAEGFTLDSYKYGLLLPSEEECCDRLYDITKEFVGESVSRLNPVSWEDRWQTSFFPGQDIVDEYVMIEINSSPSEKISSSQTMSNVKINITATDHL